MKKVNVNFAAVFLMSTTISVILMTSVVADDFHGMPIALDPPTTLSPQEQEQERLIAECKEELNYTDMYYNRTMLTSHAVPTKRKEGCMLDCIYYRMGRLVKIENSKFNEYAFPRLDPGMTIPDPTKVKNIYEAIAVCKRFLEGHRIEKCNLMYQYRDCVSNMIHGLHLSIPPSIRN